MFEQMTDLQKGPVQLRTNATCLKKNASIVEQMADVRKRARPVANRRDMFEKERVRLKLLSPLGVMQRLLSEAQHSVDQRAEIGRAHV